VLPEKAVARCGAVCLHRHDVADPHFGAVDSKQGRGLFLDVADDGVGLCHRFEGLRFDLRRAARDDDARIGAALACLAYGLARLAHGFVGHRAAVDDNQIRFVAQLFRQGMAFRQVQTTAHGDDFGAAQPNALQSASPVKTCVAAPSISIGPPSCQPMRRSPPGRWTVTGDDALTTADCGNGRGASTGAARERQPDAPLPHAQADILRINDGRNIDVDFFGETADPSRSAALVAPDRRHRHRAQRK
jgi:hypothetical protein